MTTFALTKLQQEALESKNLWPHIMIELALTIFQYFDLLTLARVGKVDLRFAHFVSELVRTTKWLNEHYGELPMPPLILFRMPLPKIAALSKNPGQENLRFNKVSVTFSPYYRLKQQAQDNTTVTPAISLVEQSCEVSEI